VLPRSLPARAAPYLERACPFPGREISYIDRVRVLLGRRGRGGVDAVPNANPMARATRAATGIRARKGVIRLLPIVGWSSSAIRDGYFWVGRGWPESRIASMPAGTPRYRRGAAPLHPHLVTDAGVQPVIPGQRTRPVAPSRQSRHRLVLRTLPARDPLSSPTPGPPTPAGASTGHGGDGEASDKTVETLGGRLLRPATGPDATDPRTLAYGPAGD
jgi:hypothetical protein